ncbi:hypothetical protein ACJX0J_026021, partial [Zea mays]
ATIYINILGTQILLNLFDNHQGVNQTFIYGDNMIFFDNLNKLYKWTSKIIFGEMTNNKFVNQYFNSRNLNYLSGTQIDNLNKLYKWTSKIIFGEMTNNKFVNQYFNSRNLNYLLSQELKCLL